MAAAWFLLRKGETSGPFGLNQLRELVESGKVCRTDRVREDGSQRWVPAEAIRDLFQPSLVSPAASTPIQHQPKGNGQAPPGVRLTVAAPAPLVTGNPQTASANPAVPRPVPMADPSPLPGRSQRGRLVWAAGTVLAVCAIGGIVALVIDQGRRAERERVLAELGPQAGQNDRRDLPGGRGDQAPDRQHEKLHAERLELERQQAEVERRKREDLEAKIREREAAEKALEFSPAEFAMVKEAVTQRADSIGRGLLSGTHPTGTYTRTAAPTLTLTRDRREVGVSIVIYWRGVILDEEYQTEFAASISKKDGLGTLKVNRDTAIVKIDPEFLRRTEAVLREQFRDAFKFGR